MSDDDITQTVLRASAYLDGELDPAETALAEADPAVMAEVERLRELQTGLRDVDPPSDATRDAAVAAALAEFATLRRPSPVVVPIKRRPAYAGWLGAAAAVVAIGLVGVVIAQSSSGGDDDDAGEAATELSLGDSTAGRVAGEDEATAEEAAETLAASAQAEAPAATELPAADAPLVAGGDAEDADATFAPPATAAPAATEAPAGTEAPAESSAEATTDAGGNAPAFDASVPIADEFELARAGVLIAQDETDGKLPVVTDQPCGTDLDPRDFVLAEGLFLVDGNAVAVLIAVERSSNFTTAFARDECVVIAQGREQ
jgi:hypothetical protein